MEPVEMAPKWTVDQELELLFDPTIIPQSLRSSLPEGLHVRPLSRTDHLRNHLPLLQVLTSAPPLTPSHYSDLFTSLLSCPSTYFILVFVSLATDTVIACGTLMVEQKFIRGGGKVGHIEDIAVDKQWEGKGLGKKLIMGLEELGRGRGCYKCILDCSKDNIGFYEKCGFTHKEYEMVKYAPVGEAATAPKM